MLQTLIYFPLWGPSYIWNQTKPLSCYTTQIAIYFTNCSLLRPMFYTAKLSTQLAKHYKWHCSNLFCTNAISSAKCTHLTRKMIIRLINLVCKQQNCKTTCRAEIINSPRPLISLMSLIYIKTHYGQISWQPFKNTAIRKIVLHSLCKRNCKSNFHDKLGLYW